MFFLLCFNTKLGIYTTFNVSKPIITLVIYIYITLYYLDIFAKEILNIFATVRTGCLILLDALILQ